MSTIEERVSLAPHSTLGVGGSARYFADCTSQEEIVIALRFASEHALPVAVLGGGSNTLVPDEGFEGLVLKVSVGGIEFNDLGDAIHVTAGAGVSWDALVREAEERSLWGIENLAGIPGTVGGAVVQNIGAYGAELSQTFEWAETAALADGSTRRVAAAEAAFAYRTSMFKTHRDLIITCVGLRLAKNGVPRLSYPDLQSAMLRKEPLTTPSEIAAAVRRIRSAKFPQDENTAGSFFKNPIVEKGVGAALKERFPDLPLHDVAKGRAKVSLAWILDRVLGLKGYATGAVRLYEKQPLVLVAKRGASASDIETFADTIARRVKEATSLVIEREVETMRAR